MKPLPLQFTKGQFIYTQIHRDGSGWCIYRQQQQGTGLQWFEVVKVKERKPFTLKGKAYEAAEAYPNDEDWGTLGFTCPTKERAYQRLGEMLNNG